MCLSGDTTRGWMVFRPIYFNKERFIQGERLIKLVVLWALWQALGVAYHGSVDDCLWFGEAIYKDTFVQ